jgi:hypothetical protein
LAVGPNTITIAVTAQDKIAKKTYTLTVTRLDQTPPAAPLVSGTTPSASATPTWTWISGGGGNGNYRYKLDNSDLTAGATAATARTFTPISALADGIHELYVQERDSAGNWSATGSFKIAVTVGPVSWYKFDGNLKDSGPNLNHGVASGGVAFIADHAGVANRAVSFQSGNGQMETGDAAIRLGSAFTVSAWVLVRDSADLQYFMDAGNGGFGMASTYGSVAFVMIGGTTNNANCYVGIGQWAHITGTYNGTDIKIYKNGVLQQTTIEPKPGIDWTPGNLLLGFHNSTYWTGALDDVRFYNRLLSQAEITAIANGSM